MGTLHSSTRHARVLVVDDDPVSRLLLVEALDDLPIEVETSDGVATAIECLRGRPPALVILDWRLGAGTGREVIAAIGPLRPAPRVIVVSASRLAAADLALVTGTGARFLLKPFDLEEIREAAVGCLEESLTA